MNILSSDKQAQVIQGLCEGLSLRSTSRLFGVHRTTIMKLLVRAGENSEKIMAEYMQNLNLTRLELDEIWTFCGKKQKRIKDDEWMDPELEDVYIFYAVDPVTKLIPAWEVGKRDSNTTLDFIKRLKGTLNGNRVQLSTDAFVPYRYAIYRVFGDSVDYATIRKEYQSVPVGPGRYAPPRVAGTVKRELIGDPTVRFICTSHVERANLTLRTFQRRFTRLSLGFSRKMENLLAAVALHFAYYNFCWQHQSIKKTPAMAAGIVESRWSVEKLLTLT